MWTIYDFAEPPSSPKKPPRNLIFEWASALPVAQQAKLNQRLSAIQVDDRNERGEFGPPNFVVGPLSGKFRALYKIKIQGGPSGANVRVIICRGPQDPRREITLLYGAKELNNRWEPRDARERALQRLQLLESDARWRVIHERVPR